MEYAETIATRVLPIVRRRTLAPIRYAHSGVGPAVTRPPKDGTDATGTAAIDRAAADDRTGAFPVVSPAHVRPAERSRAAERVRLVDRIRRAGNGRLTERIRLTGRGLPPEIAHE